MKFYIEKEKIADFEKITYYIAMQWHCRYFVVLKKREYVVI